MMIRPRARQFLLSGMFSLALFFGILCSSAWATQILLRSPRELGDASSLVVQARVVSTRSFWNASHSKILTGIELAVERGFKGNAPTKVQVVQLGGVVDGVRMHVAGSLSWHRGEELLLFLENARGNTYRVAGFSQGKFLVERAGDGTIFVRRPAPTDIEFVQAGKRITAAYGQQLRIPLRRFLAESLPSYREEK